MRTLSPAARNAVNAVVTSPGHLIELAFDTSPARWSDIGTVSLTDGRIYTGVDMKVDGVAFMGDSVPAQFTVTIGNLDNSIGALLLDNDVASVPVLIYGFDARAIDPADLVSLGNFSITQARIGIDTASITCAPVFYTAPFLRVDASYGFTHATPDGTEIVWGADRIVLQRTNGMVYG